MVQVERGEMLAAPEYGTCGVGGLVVLGRLRAGLAALEVVMPGKLGGKSELFGKRKGRWVMGNRQ